MSVPRIPLLVVEPVQETRVVLQESLNHAGIDNRVSPRLAPACGQINRAAVLAVLVDLDHLTFTEQCLLARKARHAGVRVFAVGTNRPTICHKNWVFVRKPYHFRDLIHKIENNLDSNGPGVQAAA